MKVSKFIKVDKDVLVEYIYSDTNLLGESYKVLVNTRDDLNSFLSNDLSNTLNTQENNLVPVDRLENRYGLLDENEYNFIQTKDYPNGIPIRYDRIKFHFPVNYTFSEYIGFYINVYTLDFNNEKTYELSNYFFDISDPNRINEMSFSSPEILFQEQLWGKNIEVSIPSVYALSQQRSSGSVTANSINGNLTDFVGLSQTSPVMIDFNFLTKRDVINNVTTYLATQPRSISFPQVPEFENLSVTIRESGMGDFFEIVGLFNKSESGFQKFIEDSFTLGKRYYVEYHLTKFEENIRGKTSVFTVTDNFSDPIEYRPIIKFSSTTAVIDVEMKLIDRLDNSQITRKASYGMLSNQIAKYSLKMNKINVSDSLKPKIYNMKSTMELQDNNLISRRLGGAFRFEEVEVPFPVITERANIVAKSDNVKVGGDTFYGLGKLRLMVYPFDNIVKFIVAEKFDDDATRIEYFDLTGSNEVNLVFKNENLEVKCDLYNETDEVNLQAGVLVFKIFNNQIQDIRSIFNSGINAFYITSKSNDVKTIVYSGTFKMYDSDSNLRDLNAIGDEQDFDVDSEPRVIEDQTQRETALITRRKVLKNTQLAQPVSPRLSQLGSNIRSNIRRQGD